MDMDTGIDTPSKSHFAHYYDKGLPLLDGHNGHGNQGLNGHDGHGNHGLNGHNGHDNQGSNMRLSAGIVFRSHTNGHKVPEVSGSFVSVDINGLNPPTNVETKIIQPDIDHPDGPNKVITGSPHRVGGVIGHVNFNDTKSETSNGFHHMHQQNGHFNHMKPRKEPYPLPDPHPSFGIVVYNVFAAKRYGFDVKATDTVKQLNKLIFEQINIPGEQQILNFNGKKLASNETLGHYGIKEGSVINLETRLRGG